MPDETQDPNRELGTQVSSADLRAYWYDFDGIYEISTSPTEEQRIEQIAKVLRTRHSMIYHVERLLGLTQEVGS